MKFRDLLDKILNKIEVSLTEEIRDYSKEELPYIIFHCNEYIDGINVEFLKENPESKLKWLLLRIFKDVSFYYNRDANIDDFLEILKIMNNNNEIKSEAQVLRLFKIETIYRSSEIYFSLYHYLFIYLTVNKFLDSIIIFYECQNDAVCKLNEIKLIKNKYVKADISFLDLIFHIILIDGVFHKHEKKIFNELTSMIHKNKVPQERKPLMDILENIISLGIRKDLLRVIYKISIITVLIDNKETSQELEVLSCLRSSFNISDVEHEILILDVENYLSMNKEIIYSSSLSKIFTAFEDNISKKITKIVVENKDKIMQQIYGTKDMTLLLNKKMRGEVLTIEENDLITKNTYDILKTIPALGIFLLPGGAILLPILSKVLPFNMLPSAWEKAAEELDLIIDVDNSMNPNSKKKYPCKWAKLHEYNN